MNIRKGRKDESLAIYEQGFRDGAVIVLKELDRIIPSYLSDVWKRELQLKISYYKKLWRGK